MGSLTKKFGLEGKESLVLREEGNQFVVESDAATGINGLPSAAYFSKVRYLREEALDLAEAYIYEKLQKARLLHKPRPVYEDAPTFILNSGAYHAEASYFIKDWNLSLIHI